MTETNAKSERRNEQEETMNKVDHRKAARRQARKKDFDPSKMLVCLDCGRTVVRSQKAGNPGYKDSVFCTCEDYGSPMVPVDREEDDG